MAEIIACAAIGITASTFTENGTYRLIIISSFYSRNLEIHSLHIQ
jgi:hypothetical protein